MAATFDSISADIAKGDVSPVYVLHGEEGYFIDRLAEAFAGLVDEADRDFNLYQLYGSAQLEPAQVIETCRRYPMMADRQVVILKEAQAMRADQIDRLASYVEQPSAQTVFVICFRGEKAKGAKTLAAAKKTGVVFESVPVKARDAGAAISRVAQSLGLRIEPRALQLLTEHLGIDMAKVHSSLTKLSMILPAGATVTPEAIERHIGISKEFNTFELVDAVAERNVGKAFGIVAYFTANPKSAPTVWVVSRLFDYFSNLMILQFGRGRGISAPELARQLGLRQDWQLKKYETGARNYNARQSIAVISLLRRFDAASKGVGSRQDPYALLHDLLYDIFTTQGI